MSAPLSPKSLLGSEVDRNEMEAASDTREEDMEPLEDVLSWFGAGSDKDTLAVPKNLSQADVKLGILDAEDAPAIDILSWFGALAHKDAPAASEIPDPDIKSKDEAVSEANPSIAQSCESKAEDLADPDDILSSFSAPFDEDMATETGSSANSGGQNMSKDESSSNNDFACSHDKKDSIANEESHTNVLKDEDALRKRNLDNDSSNECKGLPYIGGGEDPIFDQSSSDDSPIVKKTRTMRDGQIVETNTISNAGIIDHLKKKNREDGPNELTTIADDKDPIFDTSSSSAEIAVRRQEQLISSTSENLVGCDCENTNNRANGADEHKNESTTSSETEDSDDESYPTHDELSAHETMDSVIEHSSVHESNDEEEETDYDHSTSKTLDKEYGTSREESTVTSLERNKNGGWLQTFFGQGPSETLDGTSASYTSNDESTLYTDGRVNSSSYDRTCSYDSIDEQYPSDCDYDYDRSGTMEDMDQTFSSSSSSDESTGSSDDPNNLSASDKTNELFRRKVSELAQRHRNIASGLETVFGSEDSDDSESETEKHHNVRSGAKPTVQTTHNDQKEQWVKIESFPDRVNHHTDKNEVAQVPLSESSDGKNESTPLDQIGTNGSQNHQANTTQDALSASIDERMNIPTVCVAASAIMNDTGIEEPPLITAHKDCPNVSDKGRDDDSRSSSESKQNSTVGHANQDPSSSENASTAGIRKATGETDKPVQTVESLQNDPFNSKTDHPCEGELASNSKENFESSCIDDASMNNSSHSNAGGDVSDYSKMNTIESIDSMGFLNQSFADEERAKAAEGAIIGPFCICDMPGISLSADASERPPVETVWMINESPSQQATDIDSDDEKNSESNNPTCDAMQETSEHSKSLKEANTNFSLELLEENYFDSMVSGSEHENTVGKVSSHSRNLSFDKKPRPSNTDGKAPNVEGSPYLGGFLLGPPNAEEGSSSLGSWERERKDLPPRSRNCKNEKEPEAATKQEMGTSKETRRKEEHDRQKQAPQEAEESPHSPSMLAADEIDTHTTSRREGETLGSVFLKEDTGKKNPEEAAQGKSCTLAPVKQNPAEKAAAMASEAIRLATESRLVDAPVEARAEMDDQENPDHFEDSDGKKETAVIVEDSDAHIEPSQEIEHEVVKFIREAAKPDENTKIQTIPQKVEQSLEAETTSTQAPPEEPALSGDIEDKTENETSASEMGHTHIILSSKEQAKIAEEDFYSAHSKFVFNDANSKSGRIADEVFYDTHSKSLTQEDETAENDRSKTGRRHEAAGTPDDYTSSSHKKERQSEDGEERTCDRHEAEVGETTTSSPKQSMSLLEQEFSRTQRSLSPYPRSYSPSSEEKKQDSFMEDEEEGVDKYSVHNRSIDDRHTQPSAEHALYNINKQPSVLDSYSREAALEDMKEAYYCSVEVSCSVERDGYEEGRGDSANEEEKKEEETFEQSKALYHQHATTLKQVSSSSSALDNYSQEAAIEDMNRTHYCSIEVSLDPPEPQQQAHHHLRMPDAMMGEGIPNCSVEVILEE